MAEQRVQRRLAAILAADVVGYSRLMGEDEEGTLANLTAHLTELSEPCIAEHRGRVVKTTGDGLLAEFASVIDAVRCAVAFQDGMAERNAGTPEVGRIEFRIGVNLGDVIVQNDDVFGDGVNVAARLEGLAEPGGIYISDVVYKSVRGKLDLSFQDLGDQKVKNITEPIRTYRVGFSKETVDGLETASTFSEPRSTPDRPSIAVLPFTNLSADPEQEFFSDGVTEDIITALSKLRGFFVIARNTMFAYKRQSTDARTVATDLGVRYVLEGSVRTAGKRVRITTQLTESSTGNQLWGERYDRDLEDVFAIQDEITASVVGCLEPELYAAEHTRLRRKPPQSLDAWECFVRAIFLINQHSEDGSRDALSLLDRAIELDPEYGQAHGLSAYTLVWRAFQGWEDMGSAIERASVATTRAIGCDSQDPWAYVARGMVAMATRDDTEAVNAFGHAVDLSPNFAYAQALLGATHAFCGRPDVGIPSIDQAVKLSPRDTFGDDFQLYYAFAHFQAERYVEAAAYAEKAIQLRPEHPNSHVMAAVSYGFLGNTEKASGAVTNLRALVPEIAATDVEQTWPFVFPEDRARLVEGLRKAGLPE